MSRKIFISYRRDDSAAHAISVAQYLERSFGAANVFLDVDRLRPGQKFPDVLDERLAVSKVVLAVIGPGWLSAADAGGRRRLDDPEDWVRLEISRALERGIPVIPLLVGGARLPAKTDLPDALQPLLAHQVAILTTAGFRNEMAGLSRDIRELLTGKRGYGLAAGLTAVLLAAVGAAAYLWMQAPPHPDPSPAENATPSSSRQDPPDLQAERDEAKSALEKAAKAGRSFRDCATCPEMVVVPPGQFVMGSPETEAARDPDEGPQRLVTLARPFAVSRFEVTRAEFAAFAGATAHDVEVGCWAWDGKAWTNRREADWRSPGYEQGDDHPVTCVNWHDAKAYAGWLSRMTGQTYGLLSEAAWEYVARAGKTTAFSTGGSITSDQANFDAKLTYGGGQPGLRRGLTTKAGSFPPNAFGVHDAHGNVWEWVEDCRVSYARAPGDGTPAKDTCQNRGLRGGSWMNAPRYLRSAERFELPATDRNYSVGFRVVLYGTP